MIHHYYKTPRRRAYRNLLVTAINEGLRQSLFTLQPGDNRWPRAEDGKGCVFHFTLPDGQPVAARVSDIGFGELSISAIFFPNPAWSFVGGAPSIKAGGASAQGFIERRLGAWLQKGTTLFKCRRAVVASLAAMEVEPAGYADFGRLLL